MFTIILPSYNHEKYIKYALDSCYYQDYDDIELIISDDCSSDGSQNVIENTIKPKRFSSRFNSIKFIKNKKNLGSYGNIKQAIRKATGDTIVILNTDDYFSQKRLSSIANARADEKWGFTAVSPINEKGARLYEDSLPPTLIDTFNYYKNNIDKVPFIESLTVNRNIAISSGNLFFNKKYAKIFDLLEDFRYCGDWAFVLCASYLSSPLYLKEELLGYRIHESNSFHSLKAEGELECDFLSILAEILFLAGDPKNEVFQKFDDFTKFKNIFNSRYCPLNPVVRQEVRASFGINIITNFNYVERAFNFKLFLDSL